MTRYEVDPKNPSRFRDMHADLRYGVYQTKSGRLQNSDVAQASIEALVALIVKGLNREVENSVAEAVIKLTGKLLRFSEIDAIDLSHADAKHKPSIEIFHPSLPGDAPWGERAVQWEDISTHVATIDAHRHLFFASGKWLFNFSRICSVENDGNHLEVRFVDGGRATVRGEENIKSLVDVWCDPRREEQQNVETALAVMPPGKLQILPDEVEVMSDDLVVGEVICNSAMIDVIQFVPMVSTVWGKSTVEARVYYPGNFSHNQVCFHPFTTVEAVKTIRTFAEQHTDFKTPESVRFCKVGESYYALARLVVIQEADPGVPASVCAGVLRFCGGNQLCIESKQEVAAIKAAWLASHVVTALPVEPKSAPIITVTSTEPLVKKTVEAMQALVEAGVEALTKPCVVSKDPLDPEACENNADAIEEFARCQKDFQREHCTTRNNKGEPVPANSRELALVNRFELTELEKFHHAMVARGEDVWAARAELLSRLRTA